MKKPRDLFAAASDSTSEWVSAYIDDLDPYTPFIVCRKQIDIKQAKKLRDWLNRAIEWKEKE